MIVVMAGQIETRIAGQTLLGHTGDVLLYPRQMAHAEKSVGKTALETVFLGFDMPDLAMDNLPLQAVDMYGRIALLAKWLLDLQISDVRARQRLSPMLLHAVVEEYRTRAAPVANRAANEMVARVRQYVLSHLAEEINLHQLAEMAGISPFHFARQFHRISGFSPMRFVREVRVQAARTLLLSTALPLKTIATKVGFADEFQLSRVFKRLTGRPPNEVRRRG